MGIDWRLVTQYWTDEQTRAYVSEHLGGAWKKSEREWYRNTEHDSFKVKVNGGGYWYYCGKQEKRNPRTRVTVRGLNKASICAALVVFTYALFMLVCQSFFSK